MDYRVAVLCFVLTLGSAEDRQTRQFYKTDLSSTPAFDDQTGEKSENTGFVQPLDFASFTSQFFQGSSGNLASAPFTSSFGGGFDFFGAESKDNKVLQPFPNSPFEQEKENGTGFVTPIKFVSQFDGQQQGSPSAYRPEFYLPKSTNRPASSTASDDGQEAREFLPSTPTTYRNSKKIAHPGKSNYPSPRQGYKSEHAPGGAVYADSADVEVFYPKERAILPQINGRPKPYDGYRAASDVEARTISNDEFGPSYSTDPYDGYRAASDIRATKAPALRRTINTERGAQQFHPRSIQATAETKVQKREEPEEESEDLEDDEEEEEEEDEKPKPKNSGYRYQYDDTLHIPDLVIKKYPYETPADNDREFTADYETYKKSIPSDLERHFGAPDYYVEKYTVAATENLAKDKNCETIDSKEKGKTCYICRNPKTGGSYEQCAYEDEPQSKKVFYGGSTSSSSPKVVKSSKHRYRRSLDFFTPSSYEYYIYNDAPELTRKARAETKFQPPIFTQNTPKTIESGFQTSAKPFQSVSSSVAKPIKKKTKKYKKTSLKKGGKKRKPRQHKVKDPSAYLGGPPASYSGERYTYEGPIHAYEGPSSTYEGPSSPYEGPSHDDYYDSTDDRIPYETNSPLYSTFYEGEKENKKRPRRKPKKDYEESKFDEKYGSEYRFGPEFFSEYEETKQDPIKRDTFKEQSRDEPNLDSFTGNVKIFKNGDVCEKKRKDSMTCMVCNNDKTGATYEQCQYASSPNAKSYTYGKQKSFSSDKPEGGRAQRHAKGDQAPEKSDKIQKKYLMTKMESKVFDEGSDPDELVTAESRGFSSMKKYIMNKDLSAEPSEEVERIAEGEDDEGEEEEEGERIEARDGIEGLDEFLGKNKEKGDNYPEANESYDEYFKRVFPEFERYGKLTPDNFDPFEKLEEFRENGPSEDDNEDFVAYEGSESEAVPTRLKDKTTGIPEQFFVTDEETKKNLERAFGDFSKRDWSKCKKTTKDKLTCYQCLDKKGIQNEECMYVDAPEAVNSHTAYHGKQDYDPAATISIQNKAAALPKEEDKTKQEESVQKESYLPLKGDMEGTASTKKIKNPIKKTEDKKVEKKIRKHPVKKYKKEEEPKEEVWDSSKKKTVDDSVVKIFLNNTNTNKS